MNRILVACVGLAALGTAFAIPAIARADDTIDKIATYTGADRQQMLEDGARKEGTVTFYTAMIVDQAVRPLKAAFEKRYPFIEVKFIRDDPEILLQKILTEYRAGKPAADVTDSGAALAPLEDANLLHVFSSPEVADWPADHKDPKGYWVATRYDYMGLAYNTTLVAQKDLPHSYDDLLDPKWKSKMVWSSSSHGGPLVITALRQYMGEDKALDYIKKLGQQDIATAPVSNRNITDRVMAGDYALQLDAFLNHPLISAKQGAPVAPQPIEPVIKVTNAALLLKEPPHPYAAMLFIDFMLSKDGQIVLQQAQYFPASPTVPASPDLDVVVPSRLGLKENVINADTLIREYPKSQQIFEQYFR